MQTLLIIVSILLIGIVLLQSGKAEGASSIISGGNDDLFKNRKPSVEVTTETVSLIEYKDNFFINISQ